MITAICLLALVINTNAQTWNKLGPGSSSDINGFINVVCTDIHGNIYVAGDIEDDSGSSSVYKWNGTVWTELGHGSTAVNPRSVEIDAIFVDNSDNVYAAAAHYDSLTLNTDFYIAKWNGTTWNQLGTGSNTLYAYDISVITGDRLGNVYAVGGFVDSLNGTYVAKWDGANWSEVGTGSNRLNANSYINTISIDTLNNIFVAGTFTDGLTDTDGNLYVAKWNGTSWSELGSGICAPFANVIQIFSVLADPKGNLYATGSLSVDSADYVSKWNGSSWDELGTGIHALNANTCIFSLCEDPSGNLYAAGAFTDTSTDITVPPYSGVIHPNYVAKWDGTNWSELGTGTNALNANDYIMSVCSDNSGNIYAGGVFTDTTVTFTIFDTTYFDSVPTIHTYYAHPSYVARYGVPTTSVTQIQINNSINVYPNPTSDELNITGITENTNYRLLNVTGVCVQNGILHSGSNTMIMGNIAAGVYVLELTDGEGRRDIVRVVKE